jgi:hypothetical protein
MKKVLALGLSSLLLSSCVRHYVNQESEDIEKKEIVYETVKRPSFELKLAYGYGKPNYIEVKGFIEEMKQEIEVRKIGKEINEYEIRESKNCAKAVANYTLAIPIGMVNVGFCLATCVVGLCLIENFLQKCVSPIMSIGEKWNFSCKVNKEVVKKEKKGEVFLREEKRELGVEASGKKNAIDDYINISIDQLGINQSIKLNRGVARIEIPEDKTINYSQLEKVASMLDCDAKKVFDSIEEKLVDVTIEYKGYKQSYGLKIKSNDFETIDKTIKEVCK